MWLGQVVCVCVGEGGSGSDTTDVGHVIQMRIRQGSQNGGMVGPLSLWGGEIFVQWNFWYFSVAVYLFFYRECTTETHMYYMQQKMLLLSEFTRTQKGETLQWTSTAQLKLLYPDTLHLVWEDLLSLGSFAWSIFTVLFLYCCTVKFITLHCFYNLD